MARQKSLYQRVKNTFPTNYYLYVTQEATETTPLQGYLSHSLPTTEGSLPPQNAIRKPLPFVTPEDKINFWNGKNWEVHVEHRQLTDHLGRIIEGSGTPFLLPGDTYLTPLRYMDVPGPLPEDALLEHPEAPPLTFEETQTQLLDQLSKDAKLLEDKGHLLSSLGYEVDATVMSFMKLEAKITVMHFEQLDSEETIICLFSDYHNQVHDVNITDLRVIQSEIRDYINKNTQLKFKLRKLILSVTEDQITNWRSSFDLIQWDDNLELVLN